MIKRLRQAARQRAGGWLARRIAREPTNLPLDPSQIKRVLVVRMNGRMGNTLFLTPLLHGLSKALPDATIDILVLYPAAAGLLRGLPGLRRVMMLPHKGWWRLHRSMATLRLIRSEHYDLAIDPSPDSLGGRLALTFCRARFRLGFGGRNQWAALTHSVAVQMDTVHEALRPLALLARLPAPCSLPDGRQLRLGLDDRELEAGRERLEALLARCAAWRRPEQPMVGFFAHARGRKDLGAVWWREFWSHWRLLEPDTIPIEVLPTAGSVPVLPDGCAIHLSSPRQLAATMAATHLFISADTGPLHLASATDVPVVALFGPTRPERFGPLKRTDLVVRLDGRSPREVATACRAAYYRRPLVLAGGGVNASVAPEVPVVDHAAANPLDQRRG